MPGLVPGIHVLAFLLGQDVDGRDEPGHHDAEWSVSACECGCPTLGESEELAPRWTRNA